MQIVLFHSALGRRPAIERAAERLRAVGHDVAAPDLYDGATFDDVEAGVAQMKSLGWATLLERAQAAVPATGPLVLAGLSMGAGLAMTDEGEPMKAVEQVARSGAPVSMHVYPGAAHLFTDEDLPDEHDARSTELLWSRSLAFLAELGEQGGGTL